jgi:hypothetical protein
MADNITIAKMHSILVANKPGEGERLLAALKTAGVNLTAVWGYAVGKKQSRIDIVADDPKLLAKVVRKLKIPVDRKGAIFLINGEDHVGALEEPMAKLAAAGINVFAAAAVCGGAGRYGAILHVDPADVRKAAKLLAV